MGRTSSRAIAKADRCRPCGPSRENGRTQVFAPFGRQTGSGVRPRPLSRSSHSLALGETAADARPRLDRFAGEVEEDPVELIARGSATTASSGGIASSSPESSSETANRADFVDQHASGKRLGASGGVPSRDKSSVCLQSATAVHRVQRPRGDPRPSGAALAARPS